MGEVKVLVPRGEVIAEASQAGLNAVLAVLRKHGTTTLMEVSCIASVLHDMLMDGAARHAPTREVSLCQQ